MRANYQLMYVFIVWAQLPRILQNVNLTLAQQTHREPGNPLAYLSSVYSLPCDTGTVLQLGQKSKYSKSRARNDSQKIPTSDSVLEKETMAFYNLCLLRSLALRKF